MMRVLLAAAALVAVPLSSSAGETVVRFQVHPMPAPKPALKYQLLPDVAELNAGNAAQNYLKCFMEQRYFFFSKEAEAERARYLTMPLAELPADKLVDYGRFALKQADWAARLDTVDWQAGDRVREGGVSVVPEEAGPLQVLASALQVRFRAEVAGRRFNDAVRTAKTMLALGRHLGEHPTEVANLVGLATAHLGLNTLSEMIQQPGCPNLYWALTDLPTPLVDLRKGVQGERMRVASDLGLIREDKAMTEAELTSTVGRLSGVLSYAREQAGRSPRTLRTELQARIKDTEKVRAAREALAKSNFPEGSFRDLNQWQALMAVGQFPPLQVVLLDEKHRYEARRDARLKLLAVPLWQIPVAGEETSASAGLFDDLLPNIRRLRRDQSELQRQIALLRHVEAVRLYAAGHAGKLPASLADIRVPLPADPVTGKPFAYSTEGSTVTLRAGSPNGGEKDSEEKVVYEVTVQK